MHSDGWFFALYRASVLSAREIILVRSGDAIELQLRS